MSPDYIFLSLFDLFGLLFFYIRILRILASLDLEGFFLYLIGLSQLAPKSPFEP